jgi:soluble lytic murein transglycosylase
VLPPVTAPYQTAAVAVRRHDFLGALQALAAQSARNDAAGRHARVLAGLYAHSLERPEEAVRLLGEEPTTPGPLEDWRLWVLADSRAATGDAALGLAALDRLLADWPDSPLWPRAAVRAIELAHQAGADERAVALLTLGRGRTLPRDLAEKRERAAWQLGVALGRRDITDSAAVRLLTEYPLAANELGVADHFPAYLLPEPQLLQRAEALLAYGLADDARNVLAVVPAADRRLEWHLLMARVFTIGNQGDAALRLLAPLAPAEPAQAARVAWARAQAWFDQAEARPVVAPAAPHKPLPKGAAARRRAAAARAAALRAAALRAAAARERYRHQGLVELDTAARQGERELAVKALRQLFNEQAAGDHIEAALSALRRLALLAPDDEVGVPFLWQRGWSEYRARNYTGAIGFWSELAAEAPRDRYPRSARYWSARAFDQLGQHDRAHALYAELAAADTTDFYRRHALKRLGEAAPAATPSVAAAEPWPADRRLGRARYLTDVGLDGLAATELGLVGDAAELRARAALQAVVLAREGRARASMDHLRTAFPALGTPLQASVPAAALELYYPLHYREAVERWAAARELPAPLVLAVIRQESAFDLVATSRSGARGLMQLMPATAQDLAGRMGLPFAADKLYDPDYSLRLGTSYLSHVLAMFDGDVELALAGYNSGPYRLRRLWREAPHREVDSFIEDLQLEEPKVYVKRILLLSDSYSRLYPELAG